MTKSILASKTFWANVIAFIAGVVQTRYGFFIPVEDQAAIMTVINIILRAQTNTGVHMIAADDNGGPMAGRARVGLLVGMLFGLLATLFICGGCVPQTTSRAELATKAMLSAQTTIVGLARAADDLCAAGTIEQPTCQRISTLYAQSKPAYDLANDALQAAIDLNTPEAWRNQEMLIARLTAISIDIATLTNKIN